MEQGSVFKRESHRGGGAFSNFIMGKTHRSTGYVIRLKVRISSVVRFQWNARKTQNEMRNALSREIRPRASSSVFRFQVHHPDFCVGESGEECSTRKADAVISDKSLDLPLPSPLPSTHARARTHPGSDLSGDGGTG